MDLELELVRHIAKGEYSNLKKVYTFSPTLLGDDGAFARLKALCHFADENKVSPSVLKHEFSWLDDEFFEDPETEAGYLVGLFKERYAKTNQRDLVLRLAEADPKDYQSVYVEGMRAIQKILSDNSHQATTSQFLDILEADFERHDQGLNQGVSLGFSEVDRHTGGVRPGHLAILAALPKRMKTWFLIKAFLAQIEQGQKPILFSLELSLSEIVTRIACLKTGVSYAKAASGHLMPHERNKLRQFAEEFADFDGVVSQPNLGERFVAHLLLEADRNDATSIIIDQFSFLTPVGNHFRENEAYKEIIYDLKNSAMTYDMPIYMAAQLNREQTNDDFPVAQKLGLTRAVEEASDLILGIQINEAMRDDDMARLGVVEGRHCSSGKGSKWLIQYDFRNTKFDLLGEDDS